MKIYIILDSNQEVMNGCFYNRIHVPTMELKKRGHKVDYMTLTAIDWEELKKSDIVVFSRAYSHPHFAIMWRCKAAGIKIVYELDDDIWNIPKMNIASTAYDDKLSKRVEDTVKEADLITTTTEPLKKILNQFHDNVKIIPNALDLDKWQTRVNNKKELRIGWSGGQNHLEDLVIIADVINDLQQKYNFKFIIQGICGKPLEADGYEATIVKSIGFTDPQHEAITDLKLDLYRKLLSLKDFYHIPFYPPELHSRVFTRADIDIGIIPIIGYKFDESKSFLKLLEYTASGTAAIASNQLPYKGVAPFTVENDYKSWYHGIEKMINDTKFREQTLKQQQKICFPKYSIKNIGRQWEDEFKNLIKK